MGADESIHHLWKQFQGPFLWGQRLSFSWLFMSQMGLCGQTNPFVTCERSFGGYFLLGTKSVFLDCLWVNKGCRGWRIHSSHAKRVSRATSEWAAIKFSFTVYESLGAVWDDESIHHLWKQFRGLYLNGQRVSFPWVFMSQNGLCGQTNPFVTCERSFRGYFWMGTE